MMTLERLNISNPLRNSPTIDWDELVQEDRVHRLIYTDQAIFDAEMTHIFGGTWVYLAHESQIPNPNDYVTAKLGLRPLIMTRDN
jgi:phenylpropionate dioxygenase-like ring-hydroxylating dioxygenase large terminal subunit